MLKIHQTDTDTVVETNGDFPELICELSVLYKVLELRGAALGYNIPRLVDLMSSTEFIEQVARANC